MNTLKTFFALGVILGTTIVNGFDFKVEVYGKGQPMLLIPGLNSDGSVWNETVAKYTDRYELHVLTLSGFAGMKPMDLSHGFLKPLCGQILSYIETNKLKNPIVMGHSLGGFMALLMAAKQFENMSEEMRAAQLDMMLPTMILSKEKIALAKQWGLDSDGATSKQAMFELMTTDLREKIAVIKSPVMLLGAWVAYKNYGATHESVASNYSAQYSKIKNFQVYMTDIGHHFIMWDDPDFLFKKVDAFLK